MAENQTGEKAGNQMEKGIEVDINHIQREFEELTAIDSVSRSERQMADKMKELLQDIGFTVVEDEAGDVIGGDAGNLYGFLRGRLPGPPILLAAHMDTVRPGHHKQAVDDGKGRITSTGDTVLGADDVAGIVEILEGIRSVRRRRLPHRDIEVIFSVAEESYCKGAGVLDYSRIHAKDAYVLDMSGPVGSAAIQAPSIVSFQVTLEGKAAHAGFEPEKGIHAIALMSQAISQIRQGHLDEETTLNIGTISGGSATNIVPERCVCRGEVRSYNHQKALQAVDTVNTAFAEAVEGTQADYQIQVDIHLEAYEVRKNDPVVLRFQRACERLGLPGNLVSTFGGSDNNQFVRHGLRGIVLSCGMYNVHSVHEYTTLEDLAAGARLVAELVTVPPEQIQLDYSI